MIFLLIWTQPEEYKIRTFKKITLSKDFYCEGAAFGDFNRDGKMDVVAGPFWFEGPDFKKKYEIYPPKTFDGANGYSDNFFAFVYDFNHDGWPDVLVIGFPGKDASWYENPRGEERHWTRHKVFDGVDDESPTFVDLNGDGKPELVCAHDGYLGWVSIDDWKFHPITPKGKYHRYTHGLGVGDVNGDGRMDILEATGWWEQPADLTGDPVWKKHPANFGPAPAQMYAYDVNGDGLNDVISTVHAHAYGLSWHEQYREGGEIKFKEHVIVGKKPEDNRYGVKFSQMHAVDLIDMDGDGLKDIVTGKRFWAHGPKGDADPGEPPVLYWFKLSRLPGGGVDFIPYLIDTDSGVGTQVVAGDLNGDKAPDIVIGNKNGIFVLLQEVRNVSREEWEKAQPKPLR